MTFAALLLTLAAANPALGEDNPQTVLKALGDSGGTGSVHALLPRAFAMAKEWSPRAALYSILGRTPRNNKLWEPEEWGFIFGDAETRDGSFEVVFHDDVLFKRQGIRESVKMSEFFKSGKFAGRRTSMVEWESFDYKECRPLAPKFVDTRRLMKEVEKYKLRPADLNQFRIAMLNARNNQCDGLGFLSQFITEKPISKKLRRKSLWIVTGAEETLYFSAKSGVLLHRRKRERPEKMER